MRSQSLVTSVLSSDITTVLLQAEIRCGRSRSALKRQPPPEQNLSKLGLYPRIQLSDRQTLPIPCYWEQFSSLCSNSYKLTQAQEVDGLIRIPPTSSCGPSENVLWKCSQSDEKLPSPRPETSSQVSLHISLVGHRLGLSQPFCLERERGKFLSRSSSSLWWLWGQQDFPSCIE